MRWLMALWRREAKVEKRLADLDERGQLALNEADAAVARAQRIMRQEARIARENQQYADRLHDRRT